MVLIYIELNKKKKAQRNMIKNNNIDEREINKTEFFALIQHIAKVKNISVDEIIRIMKEALTKSFHSNFDPDADLLIEINEESKLFKVTNRSTYVVDDSTVVDNTTRMYEINLRDAIKINPEIKVDDQISIEVDFSIFKNEIAGQIGQLFKQELIRKHKEIIYDKYKDLKGEIIKAEVVSVLPQQVIFRIEGKAEGVMMNYKRNHRQKLSPGQIVEVHVDDVRETGKGSQIEVSNGSPELVKKYLEIEIPEIEEGNIEIVTVSRIPGFKSKVAIKNNNPNIDPVGALIGPRGSRINSVSEHLFGERIDVIRWSDDINKFIANSISPAKAISVMDKDRNETTGGKIVIVPNKHHTLAIGKGGNNIKLASFLTKEKLDVISFEQAKERNIKFEWNGNVSPSEVERIERGEKIQFNKRNNRINPISSLDTDISSFTADIAEFDSSSEHAKDTNYEPQNRRRNTSNYTKKPKNDYNNNNNDNLPEDKIDISNINDSFDLQYDQPDNFSDEELKKMEAEFGFGDFDLTDFKDDEK